MVMSGTQEAQIDLVVTEIKHAEIRCTKDFLCLEANFTNICKSQDIGLKHHLLCKDEHPQKCVYALPFGNAHICTCPLRRYLSRELNI